VKLVRIAAAVTLAATALAASAAENVHIELRSLGVITQHLYSGFFRAPRAVYIDAKRSELWIADTGNDLIGVFALDGTPLYAFSDEHVREPVELLVDPQGKLLVVAGRRSTIERFNYRGVYLGNLELQGLAEKPVIGALAYDAEGNLYVGDNHAGEIVVFNPELRILRRFGARGSEEGEFSSISSIVVTGDGRIWVTDQMGVSVQVFDRRGNFERGWGRHEIGIQNFSLPEALAVHPSGYVVAVDGLRQEIKFFDLEGNFITRSGGMGRGPGNVAYPSDIAIDPSGRLYVAEKGNHRVQAFEVSITPLAPTQ
jgi:DNA-binding beta-propeller fold protein YncE